MRPLNIELPENNDNTRNTTQHRTCKTTLRQSLLLLLFLTTRGAESNMPSPVGIEILKGSKPKWRVGKELGSGACATVHLLEEVDGTSTDFAIKLAPIPTKTTKKKNSKEEINASKLYFEHVVYQNQFQDVQGQYIPNLPPYKGPPANGEAKGKLSDRSCFVLFLLRYHFSISKT